MKKKILFLFVIIIFLLTGCMKYQELNSLSIISNITISMKNDKYYVVMQEIIPSKKEDGLSYSYKYRQASSNNLEDAIKKITNHSPKTIYLKKLQNVIVKDNDKEKIIRKWYAYYQKNKNKVNRYCSLVTSENDLYKVLKVNSDYKYIDSILKSRKLMLKDMKKDKTIKVPEIKMSNKELIFTRYNKITL